MGEIKEDITVGSGHIETSHTLKSEPKMFTLAEVMLMLIISMILLYILFLLWLILLIFSDTRMVTLTSILVLLFIVDMIDIVSDLQDVVYIISTVRCSIPPPTRRSIPSHPNPLIGLGVLNHSMVI